MKTASGQNHFEKTTATRNSLKIGEVSQASGIGIEALRFYERSGLLGKPVRSASGYRLYDEGVLERLSFIKKAQTLGFSIFLFLSLGVFAFFRDPERVVPQIEHVQFVEIA